MQKAKLAEAERDLATAQSALKDKQAALRAIQKKVADLKRTYEQSLSKRDDLESQQKKTSARLERAHKLTGGLGAWLLCVQRAHALPGTISSCPPYWSQPANMHTLPAAAVACKQCVVHTGCLSDAALFLHPCTTLSLSLSTLGVSSALCCR